MRMTALLLPAACALVLSACDNEQTAQAPAAPESPPAATAAAPAGPATPPTATAAAPATPAPSDETTGTVATAPAKPETPAGGAQTAAATPPGIEPYRGRVYTAGPVSVRLNADSTFEMNQTDGDQQVTGRYDFQNGVIRFAEPKGNVGTAKFPMRCRFQPAGTEGFKLLENEGSCAQFKDLTFRAQAG